MKIYVGVHPWLSRRTVAVEYRCDPIPGTSCRRGASYGKRYHKYPHTRNEIRAYDDAIEQGVRIRGRRSPRSLPNAWDDYLRSDVDNKNWKEFRRTQYKIS